MLGSLEKSVAIFGTPLAVIYTIGHLAQVVNVWWIEKAYTLNFIAAWHVVSLLDRSVVIGLGLKYLAWTLPVVAMVLWLLVRLFRSDSGPVSRYAILRDVGRRLLPGSEDEDQRTWFEWWIWLVCGSFVVSLLVVFVWLPVQAFLSPEDDPVLAYLPLASITVAAGPETDTSNSVGTETAFTDSIEHSYSAARGGQAVENGAVEGVLLSHDEQYWYVLSEGERDEGQVVIVPVDRTSEILITPGG
jgi:hypothetical protein